MDGDAALVMADINPAVLKRTQNERDEAYRQYKELMAKYEKLELAHAQLMVSHNELVSKNPGWKLKKDYEYGQDECRPLTLGSICEKCGYVYILGHPRFMMRPNDKAREPHAITK